MLWPLIIFITFRCPVHNHIGSQAFLMIFSTKFMNGLYQGRRIVRIGKLRNAMSQIEHMTAAETETP